ncbi:MAG: hypothetical protein ACYDAB_16665 [bacterium]
MTRWIMPGVAVAAAGMLGLYGAFAAEMGTQAELKTAIAHAGYAEKAETMKDVTMHLHHVLNCLVGPNDKMFDKMAGNPCQGQGDGIMPDIKKSMGADQEYQVAWWLAHMAGDAITMGNMAQAKAAAHIIGVQLTSMSKM